VKRKSEGDKREVKRRRSSATEMSPAESPSTERKMSSASSINNADVSKTVEPTSSGRAPSPPTIKNMSTQQKNGSSPPNAFAGFDDYSDSD